MDQLYRVRTINEFKLQGDLKFIKLNLSLKTERKDKLNSQLKKTMKKSLQKFYKFFIGIQKITRNIYNLS